MDKLLPEDFYVPAHQNIFEAIFTLYNTDQPLDAVTVSEELRRRGALDKIGGIGYLTRGSTWFRRRRTSSTTQPSSRSMGCDDR